MGERDVLAISAGGDGELHQVVQNQTCLALSHISLHNVSLLLVLLIANVFKDEWEK